MVILWTYYPQNVLNEVAMDIVDGLRAFVATAQTRSFTAAADQMGISNRLTSKYVAELEEKLGVRLFQRTTRRVGLTPVGEDLLARAPALLDDLDDVLANATAQSLGFSGVIRISAPVTFGEIYVGGMLGRFGAKHPNLTLDLRLDDAFVDLATDGIDLAFRIGQMDVQPLKARKLGAFQGLVVASPPYLKQHGTPLSPVELTDHQCIIDTNRRTPRRWLYREGNLEKSVDITGSFIVNSARTASELAAQGLGVAYLPKFAVGDGISSGRLVQILEGYFTDAVPIHAIYLEGRRLPRKVRALIDFAHEDIRQAGIL